MYMFRLYPFHYVEKKQNKTKQKIYSTNLIVDWSTNNFVDERRHLAVTQQILLFLLRISE